MVNRLVLLVFFWSALTSLGVAQTQDTEAQTLRQILGELRAIHEDMRVTETTQLLVAELQMQQAAVNRATESTDNARGRLNQLHLDQKRAADDLARVEDQLDKSQILDERNAISQELDRQKSNVAALKNAERDTNTTLLDMEQRLQNAQDKLASIEAELNAAISRLGPTSKGTGQR
jgi:chromosome segregation ATPase